MSKFRIPFILQILIFLIPLNIYVIGDWMGSGIQALFFRYQQTNMGNSLIFLNREIFFVTIGILAGKSAYASVFWGVGVALICIATLVVVYGFLEEEPSLIRYSAFLNAGGALLFTLAVIIQYGLFLNGPAGIAIPIGIPLILGVAYWQYQWNPMNAEDDEEEDDEADEEPGSS